MSDLLTGLDKADKDAQEALRDVDRECNSLSASVEPEDNCDTVPADIGDIDTDDLL